MSKIIPTPKGVNIKPQRMDFEFNDVPTYWFDNEPVQTHLLNALSLTFPDGERFFVDSVRAFRHLARDKKHNKAISGFIGQEAMHSLEHDSFNQFLSQSGYQSQVEGGVKLAQIFINGGRKNLSKEEQLAATAALEHITAIMAQWLLSNTNNTIEKIDPTVRNLWLWHAIEETEHKAVAFDLLQQVTGGSYLRRVRIMLPSSWFLAFYSVYYTYDFLRKDGLHKKPLTIAKGVWQLVKPGGLISSVVPAWLQYFKPGFHPWEIDDSHLIDHWRAILEDEPTQPTDHNSDGAVAA